MRKNDLAILCDFDGTVTKEDVGFRIYTRFGDERWLEINKRWRRGEISSKECLIGEYSLIDASEDEVRDYILTMEIDPGFPEFIATCRESQIPLAVVSDGFDFYIKTVLQKYGLSDVEVLCNNLRFNGRRVKLSFPFYDQGCGACGNCKRFHVQRFHDACKKVVYIGDGLSDRFAARASDVVFAKSELMEYLEEHNVSFMRFSSLNDINRWLTEFLKGNVDLPALSNTSGSPDPCQEFIMSKNDDSKTTKLRSRAKTDIKKKKMKKIVEDMGDRRYIVYYNWS